MRLPHLLFVLSFGVLLASCGQTGPELTKTASGTWLSEKIQGEKQVVLTTTSVTEGGAIMDITVLDVTTGFLPKGELLVRPDESKSQIVRLGVKVANVGTKDAAFQYDNLLLSLKNGTQGRVSFYVNQGNATDFIQSKVLKPGEQTEGAMYYELPSYATRSDMILEYKGTETTTRLTLLK